MFVGCTFCAVGVLNHFLYSETKEPRRETESAKRNKKESIVSQWKKISSQSRLHNVMLLNAAYWLVISGSQMTILPLVLVSKYDLSSAEIGLVFGGMSLIGVLCAQPSAYLQDTYGRINCLMPACALIGACMFAAPMVEDLHQFLALVGGWTLAGTMVSTAPTAYVSDIVSDKDRGQALAMLRTVGDVGMLSGAIISGRLADLWSQPEAVQINGALMAVMSGYVGIRFLQMNKAATEKDFR